MKKLKLRQSNRFKIRKLWELPNGYQCSVIGTCLSDQELEKINQRKDVRGGMFRSSFELHNRFVQFSYEKCTASVTMHNLLLNKYRLQVGAFHKVKDDEQLETLWVKAKSEGKIAGAYWAMCTHPTISPELLTKCYGEIHMISHDSVQALSKAKKQIEKLRLKGEKLVADNLAAKNKFNYKTSLLKSELNSLKKRSQAKSINTQKSNSKKTSSCLNQNQNHINTLQNENRELSTQLLKLQNNFRKQELLVSQLQQELQNQQNENSKLENNLLGQLNNNCHECDAANTGSCPGIDLCGKVVLYVGGQHKMIPHYKSLIEKNGGSFIHHDGGKEESKKRLPGMLVQADAVMCPIDCISHNACLTVKKLCKHYQKQYIMMRSSGLSSLASGLEKIDNNMQIQTNII